MASIRTAGLTKDFGDLRAVNEIDLDLPEGGVAGFVGPNGAGKSTTIRMLLGLITPTSGDGEVLGHPISRPAAYLHRAASMRSGVITVGRPPTRPRARAASKPARVRSDNNRRSICDHPASYPVEPVRAEDVPVVQTLSGQPRT